MKRKFCVFWGLILYLFSCFGEVNPAGRDAENTPPPAQVSPALSQVPEADFLTIIAAGDNLLHESIIQAAFRDGTYNFEPIYAGIRGLIEPADIAFINQETPLAGERFGYSRGLTFNTPQVMGRTLADTGFDVVSHANNHAMDKGEAGLSATLDLWDSLPAVQYLGIHRSREQRDTRRVIIEKNNIKVGFLAYTYGTNGIPLPRDKPYLVSLAQNEVIAREIKALRLLCDFLVISMHWGNEYDHGYNTAQQAQAQFLADQGADLIIGHHPHVLQTYQYLPRKDGKNTLCFYSLGNFLAAQDMPKTLLGGLAYIKIKKINSQISIERAAVIPTVTHFNAAYTGFRIYPLYDYTEALANTHGRKRPQYELSLSYFTALARRILGEGIIEYNPFAP
ncbi:MAG: CapA family protein [Spirochaetaceae bacterium]|jgi:poly-gamma-glutamate synthesis protein (capsule biosynthesis protein)|nr:CapA family protein [Spirochaetaceae bacterium]